MGRILWALGLPQALSACADNPYHLNMAYLDRDATRDPTPVSFTECHGFGCTEVSHVSLTAHEWRRIAAVFHLSATDAASERRQIARAVAPMQRLVGAQTGTVVHQRTHKNQFILPI